MQSSMDVVLLNWELWEEYISCSFRWKECSNHFFIITKCRLLLLQKYRKDNIAKLHWLLMRLIWGVGTKVDYIMIYEFKVWRFADTATKENSAEREKQSTNRR